MSSKKKKRLDSYINKKLKQERRADLFKSLAASQDTITSSLQLRPSSSLGSKQFLTNQDKLDKVSTLSDRKRSRVYDQVATEKRGYHSDSTDGEREEPEQASKGDELDSAPVAGPSRIPMQVELPPSQPALHTLPSRGGGTQQSQPVQAIPSNVVGSALIRGADGEIVKPTVRQRQKKAPRVSHPFMCFRDGIFWQASLPGVRPYVH